MNTRTPAVLLVEDDSMLRNALSRILAMHDVGVIEASDGAEGIARLVEFEDRIGLIITDHQMPRVSGARFIRAAQAIHPEIPIIRMTGSREDVERHTDGMPARDRVVYLLKPFALDQFTALVKHFMRGAPGNGNGPGHDIGRALRLTS